MGKKNLTSGSKTVGTFIRFSPELKKEMQIFAINKGITLTDLIIKYVKAEMLVAEKK